MLGKRMAATVGVWEEEEAAASYPSRVSCRVSRRLGEKRNRKRKKRSTRETSAGERWARVAEVAQRAAPCGVVAVIFVYDAI